MHHANVEIEDDGKEFEWEPPNGGQEVHEGVDTREQATAIPTAIRGDAIGDYVKPSLSVKQELEGRAFLCVR